MQIYWQLVELINEGLFTIHNIKRMQPEESMKMFLLHVNENLTKNLFQILDHYFEYLLKDFPEEVLQKHRKLPSDG